MINGCEGGAAALGLPPSLGAHAQSRMAATAAISLELPEAIISTFSARGFVRQVVLRVNGAHERVCNERNG